MFGISTRVPVQGHQTSQNNMTATRTGTTAAHWAVKMQCTISDKKQATELLDSQVPWPPYSPPIVSPLAILSDRLSSTGRPIVSLLPSYLILDSTAKSTGLLWSIYRYVQFVHSFANKILNSHTDLHGLLKMFLNTSIQKALSSIIIVAWLYISKINDCPH